MTDNSIMPFGKHEGEQLKNVPDSYLKYIYDVGIARGELKEYITDNMDAIDANLERKTGKIKRISTFPFIGRG